MFSMHSTRGRVGEHSSPAMSCQSLLSGVGNCIIEIVRNQKKRRGSMYLLAENSFDCFMFYVFIKKIRSCEGKSLCSCKSLIMINVDSCLHGIVLVIFVLSINLM